MFLNVAEMTLDTLVELLERRLLVIADRDLRDNHPREQLYQLQEVSEAIVSAHKELSGQIDAKLNHYLSQSSYEKALVHIRATNKKADEGKPLVGQ